MTNAAIPGKYVRTLLSNILQDTELSLNNIAGQLGFPATSALHRSFRKSTGMTPRQYRSHSRKQRS